MKNLMIHALAILMAAPAFANLSASQVNAKALEVLINSASQVQLEGDVRAGESLSSILAAVLVRNADSGVEVKNSCIFISRDSVYECVLDIQVKKEGWPKAEAVLSYDVFADANGLPEELLVPKVRVVRGI